MEQQEEDLLKAQNPFALAILAGLYLLKSKQQEKKYYKIRLIKLLLTEPWLSKKKIRSLLSCFIDHIMELPEEETEQLLREISPLIEKGDINLALTLDDTSFAKYYKKIGKEEGREEGMEEGRKIAIVETTQKMLKEGFGDEVVMKVTGLSKGEVDRLK